MEELLQIGLGLFGGLALFLYGMNLMSNNLQEAAGERMRAILAAVTKNPFFGVLAGALATAVLQSSSATTVMTIGLWLRASWGCAKPFPLSWREHRHHHHGADHRLQAVRLRARYRACGLPRHAACQAGADEVRRTAVFGFGLLFLGIDTMGAVMKPLAENPVFTDMIAR